MKVLHIITDSNIGGAGRHLLTLADSFGSEAFSIEVAIPAGGKLLPELAKRGIPAIEVPHIDSASFSIKGLASLLRLVREKKPDIVHTHASLSGRMAARLCGCSVVHTRHSVFPPSPISANFPANLALGFLNNRLSDAIIAVSPAAKDNLAQIGTDPNRIDVIYNGILPIKACSAEEKRLIRARYGIPGSSFVISQIARLVDEKGHDYTLEAAKKWASEDPDIVVVIVGDGPREAPLRWQIKGEKINNVVMLGFVEAVEDIINISDLQINSSYGTEATSISLLEGMSLGIPAVVSDYGSNPYVILNERNGLVVPQKDSEALSQAVLKVKQDKDFYKALSKGALAEYESRFQADDMARKIEKLYKKVKGVTKGV